MWSTAVATGIDQARVATSEAQARLFETQDRKQHAAYLSHAALKAVEEQPILHCTGTLCAPP